MDAFADNFVTPLSGQNNDIYMELAKSKKKLDRLKKKVKTILGQLQLLN